MEEVIIVFPCHAKLKDLILELFLSVLALVLMMCTNFVLIICLFQGSIAEILLGS